MPGCLWLQLYSTHLRGINNCVWLHIFMTFFVIYPSLLSITFMAFMAQKGMNYGHRLHNNWVKRTIWGKSYGRRNTVGSFPLWYWKNKRYDHVSFVVQLLVSWSFYTTVGNLCFPSSRGDQYFSIMFLVNAAYSCNLLEITKSASSMENIIEMQQICRQFNRLLPYTVCPIPYSNVNVLIDSWRLCEGHCCPHATGHYVGNLKLFTEIQNYANTVLNSV